LIDAIDEDPTTGTTNSIESDIEFWRDALNWPEYKNNAKAQARICRMLRDLRDELHLAERG
jgi:hypothetical protein